LRDRQMGAFSRHHIRLTHYGGACKRRRAPPDQNEV